MLPERRESCRDSRLALTNLPGFLSTLANPPSEDVCAEVVASDRDSVLAPLPDPARFAKWPSREAFSSVERDMRTMMMRIGDTLG